MAARILKQAILTGVFCAVFAVVVDAVTEILTMWQAVIVAFISGFLGSAFAQTVMRRS